MPDRPNALIKEKSPYLLQHAYNPVHWLPWGEEAFEKARKEDKPLFLSVGYSTCHWCHVMEKESFENLQIAAVLNEKFVSVKVDREERPDVDLTYMTFLQASTGQGGWPMNVWLTPERKPFLGGTYFPVEERGGRAGFLQVLGHIAHLWEHQREKLLFQAEEVFRQLHDFTQNHPTERALPSEKVFLAVYEQFEASFDSYLGGFGFAPKFPRPVIFNLLLRLSTTAEEEDIKKGSMQMAAQSLKAMANGGIYDHLGGGFHRYSVDTYWHVPHFEKMLYDQAQMIVAYLEIYQLTQETFYRDIAKETLTYVLRNLRHEQGGFYSAEDADSALHHTKEEKIEGAYYVWTKEEIDRVLTQEESALFCAAYGVRSSGNVREESDPTQEFIGKNVLYRDVSVETLAQRQKKKKEEIEKVLSSSKQKLWEVRKKRPRPHLDDKIITAWNGLMLTALAKAYQVLGEKRYLVEAVNTAEFIHQNLVDQKQHYLKRSYREGSSGAPGFASDYAFFIQGLLDLYEASFDVRWLTWARALQETSDLLYKDEDSGVYLSVTTKQADALFSIKEEHDGAEPSPNSVAATNLLRFASFLHEETYRRAAAAIFKHFSHSLETSPQGMPQLVVALQGYLRGYTQIVFTCPRGQRPQRQMLETVHRAFLPYRTLAMLDDQGRELFTGETFRAMQSTHRETATAYVCEGTVCKEPVHDARALRQLLFGI